MKAIVLSAGYGTRLGRLTAEIPKPMLPLLGKPLLVYIIAYLKEQGFEELAINLHFRPEMIREWLGDGNRLGVHVHYSYEQQLLGTAGAIRKLESWIGSSEDFLVYYGDVLTDQPLTPLVETHLRTKALATLLVHNRPGSNSLLKLDEHHRITDFIERPTAEEASKHCYPWVNSVIQIVNRRILDYIPVGRPSDLPRDVYAKVVEREVLQAVKLTGYRCAIDSPRRYVQAEQALREGRCRSYLSKIR